MYCRECGEEYPNNNAAICVKCGVKRNKGHNYCPECGKSVNNNSDYCMNCGISLKPQKNNSTAINSNPKSKVVAALLAFFFGSLGIHRFYLGHTTIGIIQLLCATIGAFFTLGISLVVVWIWGFVEFILILTGSLKDVDGQSLV
jgi:TM2 domain-containing membrane protein YozV